MTLAAVPTFLTAPPLWLVMWVIAFVTFVGFKWLTWVDETRGISRSRRRRQPTLHTTRDAIDYFLAWPGMDPAAFLRRGAPRPFFDSRTFGAVLRIAVGITLIFVVVPRMRDAHPLVAGWSGMAGVVLALHFGVFELMAAVWRRRGVHAPPVMNAPLRSTTLAEFWGKRWNTAFHDLASRFAFKPLRRPLGVAGATMAAFVASGLVHDLVISVPARGGYGLPTLYFLIQGFAVLVERTPVARRLGITARGLVARLFIAVIVIAPAPLLFHPPFINRVILPFMEVIR